MKKFSYFLIASILMLLSGCQSEELANQQIPIGKHSLVATIEGQDYIDASRTAVDDSGNVTWITTDELGVYGSVSENVKYSSTGSGSNVTFTGDLPETEEAKWAYYPYDEKASLTEGNLTITLPENYTYTGNSYAPMLGKSVGNNKFSFKHLGGLIRFTLGGGTPDDADRFVITSLGENQPIAGQASFAIEGENVAMSITDDGKQSVSYDVSAIKDADEFQYFFVPLPVGDYTKLQVSFYKKDSETPVFTRSLSNLKVGRAEMICMPILNWNTGEQFVLGDKTEIISPELETKAAISQEKKTTLVISDVEEENLPEIGTILLKGEVSNTFPEGFLGKVISITKDTEGKYIIETEPVPLDVAFKSLYIEKTIDLYPESSSRASNDIEQDIEGFYVFTKKIEYEGEDEGFNASLEMNLGLKLDIVINTEAKVMYFALRDKIGLTGELSVEKSFDEEKKIPLGPAIPLPTITVTSPVIITPAVQLYAVLKASGEIEMCTELTYESRGRSWVRYRSEAWEGDTDPRESEDSPWNAKGSIKMNGELFTGCSADFYGTFYGIDFLSFGIETEVGTKLFGDFNIETMQNEDLGFVGINGGLNSRFELNGYFHIDANIFENELRAEIPLLKRTWGECFLYVFPTFTDLQAKVSDEELQAEISTEVTEKLLSKESQISLALIDIEGNIKEESEPIVYKNPSINKAEQATPITTTFEELEEKTEYKSCPIIQSPLLEDIVPEGKLELKYLSVSFKTKGSLRDQLIQLYKNAGGENWTDNENWLSDEPIERWYGIHESGNGKYSIELGDNNLIGTVVLSSPDIRSIDVSDNNIENLSLSGCTGLEYAEYGSNPLVTLDLSDCSIVSGYYSMSDESTYSKIKQLKMTNCKELTGMFIEMPLLESLDLSGCEKLEDIPSLNGNGCGNNLKTVNISGCKEISNLRSLDNIPLTYLNISGCDKIADFSPQSVGQPHLIEELYAANCTGLTGQLGIFPTMRIVDLENCTGLESVVLGTVFDNVYNPDYQLISLNVKGCSSMEWIAARGTYLQDFNMAGCTQLKQVEVYLSDNITNIDLSEFTLLEEISIIGEQLQSLDVTHCPELKSLSFSGNFTTIDLSNNRELEYLDTSHSLTELDLTYNHELKELSCGYSNIKSLDLADKRKLERVSCGSESLEFLDVRGCFNLKSLQCAYGQLTTLDVSDCELLETLHCNNNKLTTLDVTKNINLTNLSCSDNAISELDVSGCMNLKDLRCHNNQIKVLDVKNHASLEYISCENATLETLDVSGCSKITSLSLSGCPNLSSLNFTGCTSISEMYLLDTGLTSISLSGMSSLTKFDCGGNDKLTSLDLTGCTNLVTLDCAYNSELANLTLMSYAPLTEIRFDGTKVTHEIPSWFPIPNKHAGIYFTYEQRYTDYQWITNVDGTRTLTYKDNGYGWWFPGEPESGKHDR